MNCSVVDIKRRVIVACMATVSIAVCVAASNASSVKGLGVGEFPSNAQVFTVNPWTAAARANRGLAGERRERQTFKNFTEFEVGQIDISFDVTGGNVPDSTNDTGIAVRIFEVDDVNASTWIAGNLVKELIFPDTLPGSTEGLRFTLTDADVFTLPARFSGTTGYGLEISTPNSLSTDGNPGVWYFTNDAAITDPYPDGSFYRDGTGAAGNREASRRDLGLAMRVPEPTSVGLVLIGLIGFGMRHRVR
jgi:hypothetical protein